LAWARAAGDERRGGALRVAMRLHALSSQFNEAGGSHTVIDGD
jgi:hypothetical protein